MQSGFTRRTWTRTGTLYLFRRFIADSHTNPLHSICKSVYLKTETDKTCKVRLNADSFSLTKILMDLMQSTQPLMPLGQFFFFFFDFRSFRRHFSVMKIALIFCKCRLSLRMSIRNFWRCK